MNRRGFNEPPPDASAMSGPLTGLLTVGFADGSFKPSLTPIPAASPRKNIEAMIEVRATLLMLQGERRSLRSLRWLRAGWR